MLSPRALVVLAALGATPLPAMADDAALEPGFDVSYAAGRRDAAGGFMGGTELRNLAAHGGKLYAGNGYWEDQAGSEGTPGAQILVLDRPDAAWRVEQSFDEQMGNGRRRHLAVSALRGVTFATDGAGQALPQPATMLLAGTWDLSGLSQVFSRDDATGGWAAMTLPGKAVPRGQIQQVRALGFHRDRATHVDRVFVGNEPYGIYSGVFDAGLAGHIRWDAAPELAIATIDAPAFPGLTLRRVTGFAECDGVLYATVGQQIYRRADGTTVGWQLLYTNPRPGYSETGLRGLTALSTATGCALLATVEGYAARIVRIDPGSGGEATELDLRAFLAAKWGTRVSYVIAGYNDIARIARPDGDVLLIGFEAFYPPDAPVPAGHAKADGLDGAAWYLVRQTNGRYALGRIGAALAAGGPPLVATRAIQPSPFAGDEAVYFAGYDANKHKAHNTAWIVRAPDAIALKTKGP